MISIHIKITNYSELLFLNMIKLQKSIFILHLQEYLKLWDKLKLSDFSKVFLPKTHKQKKFNILGGNLKMSKKFLKKHTIFESSARTKSYSLNATQNIIPVTPSKQCIHFLRSDRCPPTSSILKFEFYSITFQKQNWNIWIYI